MYVIRIAGNICIYTNAKIFQDETIFYVFF